MCLHIQTKTCHGKSPGRDNTLPCCTPNPVLTSPHRNITPLLLVLTKTFTLSHTYIIQIYIKYFGQKNIEILREILNTCLHSHLTYPHQTSCLHLLPGPSLSPDSTQSHPRLTPVLVQSLPSLHYHHHNLPRLPSLTKTKELQNSRPRTLKNKKIKTHLCKPRRLSGLPAEK